MSSLEQWSMRVSYIAFGLVNWPVVKEMQMVFLGTDWAEAHHDVCLLDEQGKVLGKRRVVDGLEGVRRLHELVAEHAEEPEQVVVGIEIDRGLLVHALVAAGYQLHAINPLAVSRYRERHGTSG